MGQAGPLSVTQAQSMLDKWKRISKMRLRRVRIFRNVFIFCFIFFKQIFDQTLTSCIFLNTTPNELNLFPTSLKFSLVYFKIYLEIFQTTFLHCFETMC